MKFISRFILIIISLATSIALSAQEATIKKVAAAPMDISAAKYKRSDLNGAACALVKVQVLTDEVEFTGNVVGTPEHRTGEYWVYLSPGTKMLGIASTSFLPMMLSFPEHGIPELQPATTYIVTLALPETNTTSTVQDNDIELTPYRDTNGKYGFRNNSGTVIAAQYDFARPFSDGLAKVRLNGKFGFIDRQNRMVIPPIYDEALSFADGTAQVKSDGKWGFIDKNGVTSLSPENYSEQYFSEGLACININNYFGFINKNGLIVIPVKYEDASEFSEGLAGVSINGKWGFIDKRGNFVIQPTYDFVSDFYEGLARVSPNEGDGFGFIDKYNRLVIPAKYYQADDFSEGLAGVEIDGKWGFIDKEDNLVIPAMYEAVGAFVDGKAMVKLNDKYGMIDKQNRMVIPAIYQYHFHFSDGLAEVVDHDWKRFYIDTDGNKVE